MTYFMTVLHRCALHEVLMVVCIFQEEKNNLIGLTHNPSERNLKDEERDKFNRKFL